MKNVESIVQKAQKTMPGYRLRLPALPSAVILAGSSAVLLYAGCVFDSSGLRPPDGSVSGDAHVDSSQPDGGVDAGDAYVPLDARLDAEVTDSQVVDAAPTDGSVDSTVDAAVCPDPTIQSLVVSPNPAKTGQNYVTLTVTLDKDPCYTGALTLRGEDFSQTAQTNTVFSDGPTTDGVVDQISLPFGYDGNMLPLGIHDITYTLFDANNNSLDEASSQFNHIAGLAVGKCTKFTNYAYDGQSLIIKCNVLNGNSGITASYGGQSAPTDFDAQMIPANVVVTPINNGAEVEVRSNSVIDLPNVPYQDIGGGIMARPLEISVHLEDPNANPVETTDGTAYVETWPNRTIRIYVDNQSGPTCQDRYANSGATDFLFGRNGAFPGWQDLVNFPASFTGNKQVPAGNLAIWVQNLRDLPQEYKTLLNMMYNHPANPQSTYSCLQSALNRQDGMGDPISDVRVEIFD